MSERLSFQVVAAEIGVLSIRFRTSFRALGHKEAIQSLFVGRNPYVYVFVDSCSS